MFSWLFGPNTPEAIEKRDCIRKAKNVQIAICQRDFKDAKKQINAIKAMKSCYNEALNTYTNYLGRTVLHMAVYDNRIDILKALKDPVVDIQDKYGRTALHYAVLPRSSLNELEGSVLAIQIEEGKIAAYVKLPHDNLYDLERPVVNLEEDIGEIVVHYPIVPHNNLDIIEWLLVKKFDPNIKDKGEMTPLNIIENEWQTEEDKFAQYLGGRFCNEFFLHGLDTIFIEPISLDRLKMLFKERPMTEKLLENNFYINELFLIRIFLIVASSKENKAIAQANCNDLKEQTVVDATLSQKPKVFDAIFSRVQRLLEQLQPSQLTEKNVLDPDTSESKQSQIANPISFLEGFSDVDDCGFALRSSASRDTNDISLVMPKYSS